MACLQEKRNESVKAKMKKDYATIVRKKLKKFPVNAPKWHTMSINIAATHIELETIALTTIELSVFS